MAARPPLRSDVWLRRSPLRPEKPHPTAIFLLNCFTLALYLICWRKENASLGTDLENDLGSRDSQHVHLYTSPSTLTPRRFLEFMDWVAAGLVATLTAVYAQLSYLGLH